MAESGTCKRVTQLVTFRLDTRIVEKLNVAAANSPRSRNFLVEQVLAEKCGLPFYEWRVEDQENVGGVVS